MPKHVVIMAHPEDHDLKNELLKHLRQMQRKGIIAIIEEADSMQLIDIVILLLSPDAIADDQFMRTVHYAIRQKFRIVPIIVRDIDLAGLPEIDQILCLPRNGKSVMSHRNKDSAWKLVAQEIREIAK